MDPREALVALNMIDHVGPIRARQLLDHFGDATAILRASKHQLLHVKGIGDETADSRGKCRTSDGDDRGNPEEDKDRLPRHFNPALADHAELQQHQTADDKEQ